jgi:hypothetical protein
MPNSDLLNDFILDEIKSLCEDVIKTKIKGMSAYLSKEDRDEDRLFFDGRKEMAQRILRIIKQK